jgi:hypothetical protein
MSLTYNGATNRISTSGYGYAANGNMTAMPGKTITYDIANRLQTVSVSFALAESYAYAPDNKRVYKKKPNGATFAEEMYFYVGDQKLATKGGIPPVLIGPFKTLAPLKP